MVADHACGGINDLVNGGYERIFRMVAAAAGEAARVPGRTLPVDPGICHSMNNTASWHFGKAPDLLAQLSN